MLIADAQVHIWGPNTPERPWAILDPPYKSHKGRPSFSKDDLLQEMQGAGVDRAVIVPAPLEGFRNDVALAAARQHPDRLAVMGLFDLKAPDARGKIQHWREQRGMLGLRLTCRLQGDESDDWVWAEAEAADVPIMIWSAGQLSKVERAAQRHSGLRLVIDHLAIPLNTKDEMAFAHLDQLLALAKYSNIAVKASALPYYTTDSYPYRRLHPYIRRVYDAFGPKRMFWGADMTRQPCSYRQAVTMFTEEIPWFTDEDKEWVMGRGLCDWIGWRLP